MKTKVFVLTFITGAIVVCAQTDPGPRNGSTLTGGPLPGITAGERLLFDSGKMRFEEMEDVANGLGPRFNLDSCAGCHAQPATGGTSPAENPQVAAAIRQGAVNTIPPFVAPDGPVRVARFRRNPDGSPDGGVHNLFVITGRNDAPSNCSIQQPDFSRQENIALRIPTPTFGLGLIEAIPDGALRRNLAANADQRRALGIGGRFNVSGNDGTITRYGWKAQNKSLTIFSGEAYNVEIGVTNDVFPQEREDNPQCTSNGAPEDHANPDTAALSDVDQFTLFMRYLAPPQPGARNASVDHGQQLFDSTGCATCHTPVLRTGVSSSAALTNQDVHLYSDLALHRMGQALNDGVNQGLAQGEDWRTAPLWGLGERIFFLHDGRTKDLLEAIRQHDSPGSEAHQVIQNFGALKAEDQQDLLNFLRAL